MILVAIRDKIGKRICFIGILIFICLASGITVHAAQGWVQDSVGYYYLYEDGTWAANKWEQIEGKWYYFNSSGYRVTGWQKISDIWYYFGENGVMATGAIIVDGKWYYMDENGAMQTGIHVVNGSVYYYGSDGAMRYGWVQLENGSWMYFGADGKMITGWQKIDGAWYYLSSGGVWVNDNSAEEGTIKGIDVSKWQGTIDWDAVKNDGIEFAFVRVGHGNTVLDPYYKKNMTEANRVEIPVGVYYYSKAQTQEEAIRDAQFVIDNLQGFLISYPVVIDLEDESQVHLGKQQITEIGKAFCDEIAAAGYTPMVYCNENWYRNYIDFNQLEGVERWIARYNVKPNSNISRGIWQCGSTARIAGISGNVDVNFGYKDYTTIVTPRTSSISTYKKRTGLWKQDHKGRWYSFISGGFPINEWELIDGNWYYFNDYGYMQTGWQMIRGQWYYLNDEGVMQTGWKLINGNWYYMNSDGVMVTGWLELGEYKYYLNSDGAMVTGWNTIDDAIYYFDGNGCMGTGWLYLEDKWYYLNVNGEKMTGWQHIGGIWYYMDAEGIMQTGWKLIGGKWYYMNTNGAMQTGWKLIGGKWYYLYSSGEMAANTWIGSYYVDAGGAWIP